MPTSFQSSGVTFGQKNGDGKWLNSASHSKNSTKFSVHAVQLPQFVHSVNMAYVLREIESCLRLVILYFLILYTQTDFIFYDLWRVYLLFLCCIHKLQSVEKVVS